MNIKKIRKQVITIVLSSAFVITSAGFVNIFSSSLSTYNSVSAEENAVDKKTTTEKKEKIIADTSSVETITLGLTNGSGEIEVKNYRTNNEKSGYLLVDIEKKFVKENSSSNEIGKDANPIELSTNFNNGIENTLVEYQVAQYSSDKSDFYRFYVPYNSATGEMTLSVDGPEKLADKEIKFRIHSLEMDTDDQLDRFDGNLTWNGNTPIAGFNKVDSYIDEDRATVYKGFVFDNNHDKIYIKPEARANKVRLYIGAGNDNSNKGFNYKNKEFRVRYYSDKKIFDKIQSGYDKDKDKDKYSKNEFKQEYVSIRNGFSQVELPWSSTDGIIEVQTPHANNFLLNLKVKSLSDINVDGGNNGEDNNTDGDNDVSASIERFGKSNRYETAVSLSKEAFNRSKTAIIASGDNFADALSGGPLASISEAPLLLVNNNSSNIDLVKTELDRLDVEKIYILGGKNSLTNSTEDKLSIKKNDKDRLEVIRLEGKDRFETSMNIFKEVTRQSGSSEYPILVNGYTFADALSAGPLAANRNKGIVLTNGKTAPAGIDKNESKNIVIGGTSSMDSSFKGGRISGKNRYETSSKIADMYFDKSENIMVASGEKYPDGLASISLYNKYKAPLLLTEGNNLPSYTKTYIKDSKPKKIYVIGGSSSVSNDVYNTLKNL